MEIISIPDDRACNNKVSVPRRYGIILVTILLLSCADENHERANTTVSIGMPQALARTWSIPNTSLHITVHRDDADSSLLARTPATHLDGAAVMETFQVSLPPGAYSIFLRYHLTSNADQVVTLIGETHPVPIEISTTNVNRLDFSTATLKPPPDSDGDGASNLAELIAGTDPPVPPKPEVISGRAQGLSAPLQLSAVNSKNGAEEIIDVPTDGVFSKQIFANPSDISLRIDAAPPGQSCGIGTKNVPPGTHTGYDVRCASTVVQTRSAGKYLHVQWTTSAPNAASYTVEHCVSNICGSSNPLTNVTEHRTAAPAGEGLYFVKVNALYDSGAVVSSDWTSIAVGPWSADKVVLALAAAADGSLYLGGELTQLFVYTGAALVVPQAGAGTGSTPPAMPKLRGSVVTSVADDAGGWYIGGEFTVFGEEPDFSNLIHLHADGSIDRNFRPRPNGVVRTLLRTATALYATGNFTEIGLKQIKEVVALDLRGNVLGTWNQGLSLTCSPLPPDGGICGVEALAAHPGVLYLGGYFSHVDGTVPRSNVAAVNALTGELVETWSPSADKRVRALAQARDLIYIGGDFTTVSEKPRQRLAAVNLDGQVTDWIADMAEPTNKDPRVTALTVTEDTLYVGGGFDSVSTNETPSASRRRLAAFDIATGKLTEWAVAVGGSSCCTPAGDVLSLAVAKGNLYVGGEFTSVNNERRVRVAAIDQKTAKVLPWTLEPNLPPRTLAGNLQGDRLFVGGEFQGLSAHDRHYLALILPDGNISGWRPDPTNQVRKLAIHNDTLYVLGKFTTIGVTSPPRDRGGGAAFELSTRSLLDWNPKLTSADRGGNNTVVAFDLAADGNTVYVGGQFDFAAGQDSVGLVATDPSSGARLGEALYAQVRNGKRPEVRALALGANGSLYVGGEFGGINNVASAFLARINTETRAPLDWLNPLTGIVRSIAVTPDRIYLAAAGQDPEHPNGFRYKDGNRDTVGRLAALDAATHNVIALPDLPNQAVFTMVSSGGRLYLGGDFGTIGSSTRARLGAIDASRGQLTDWAPQLDTSDTHYSRDQVHVLAVNNGSIYAGGSFITKDGRSMNLGEFPP